MPLSEVSGPTERFDPASSLAAYRAWTQETVAARYPALRMATDASSLIGNERDVASFAGFELLFDKMVATAPTVAMCCCRAVSQAVVPAGTRPGH
jgi:hypothetical protein